MNDESTTNIPELQSTVVNSTESTELPVHTGLRVTETFEHPRWHFWEHKLSSGVELSTIKDTFKFIIDNIYVQMKDTDDGGANISVTYDLEIEEIPVAIQMSGDDIQDIVDEHMGSLIMNILQDYARDCAAAAPSAGNPHGE